LKINYRSIEEEELVVFADASFAPNLPTNATLENLENDDYMAKLDPYLVSGFAVFHRGNLVHWNSVQRKLIALSSTAAEILAISENLDHFLIPRDILQEIMDETHIVEIFEDNTSARIMLQGCQNIQLRHSLLHSAAV